MKVACPKAAPVAQRAACERGREGSDSPRMRRGALCQRGPPGSRQLCSKMAAPSAGDEPGGGGFGLWLLGRLEALGLDRAVYGAYIEGLLREEESDEERLDALRGVLAACLVSAAGPGHGARTSRGPAVSQSPATRPGCAAAPWSRRCPSREPSRGLGPLAPGSGPARLRHFGEQVAPPSPFLPRPAPQVGRGRAAHGSWSLLPPCGPGGPPPPGQMGLCPVYPGAGWAAG